MSKGSLDILKSKIDVEELLKELNSALSEEWLAFYQYWVGAQVMEGVMRPEIEAEFKEHAEEEYHHAQELAERIKELDGVPVLDPAKWAELAICKYKTPTDFNTIALLKDNIAAERCAIIHYQKIAEMTCDKDYVTCDLAKHILAEEEQHEQDLTDYLIDIEKSFDTAKQFISK